MKSVRLRSAVRGGLRYPLLSAIALSATMLSGPAFADKPDITVTATRIPESAEKIPADIDVITGDSIRARGAQDLRGALVGASGIEVNPGGDAGPLGSVVASQGLAEMDAYLLIVDGIPYGGAFNPAIAALDLIDVSRIEVLKGAAPVTYGATSFVGAIHVIRYEGGEQPTRLLVQGGTRSSARGAFATNIATGDNFRGSVLGSVETRKFRQDRGQFERYHLLFRGSAPVGTGRFSFDLDGTKIDQTPYSPHPREGNALSARFPLDANTNPGDARQDIDRLQANFGYETKLGDIDWVSRGSVSDTVSRNVRGYLRPDFATNGTTINADGFRQRVRLNDGYFDTHLSKAGDKFDWVVGGDVIYGNGRQRSSNFEYAVLPSGANAPRSTNIPIDERTFLKDRRTFLGIYGQAIIRPIEKLTLLGGARLNRTSERRCGSVTIATALPAPNNCDTLNKTRLSGSVGATFDIFENDATDLALYVSYRNTYKPAAIDFGPEGDEGILKPETSNSIEAGFKSGFLNERITVEANYFNTKFRNLVIRENVGGLPALANAGKEKFEGVDVDVHIIPGKDVNIGLTYAYHLAKFTDFARLRPNGTIQQLAGNRLELSPRYVASAVFVYAPATGINLSGSVHYTGDRFLNKGNTAVAKRYATVDARIGYRFANGLGLFVDGDNLTNRRDPVAESEIGDAQFYRLPGRRVIATAELKF